MLKLNAIERQDRGTLLYAIAHLWDEIRWGNYKLRKNKEAILWVFIGMNATAAHLICKIIQRLNKTIKQNN